MSLSLPSQHFFSNSRPVRSSISFTITTVSSSHRNPNPSPQPIFIRNFITHSSLFPILQRYPNNCLKFKNHRCVLRSYESNSFASTTTLTKTNSNDFDFDSFLHFAELLCVISSAVSAVIFTVNDAVLGKIGKRVMAWGLLGLVGGVAIGVWIRRRQWKRIYRESVEGERLNLIERIEKLEEDLKSSATIVRVLSRQLEKLGIRFRVTRKALKEPIAEIAALGQKNCETTRALAARGDVLEKELGEIQKVLLAMQEQQQKQLELILAIVEKGKLLERNSKQATDEQIDLAKEHLHNAAGEVDQIDASRVHNDRI